MREKNMETKGRTDRGERSREKAEDSGWPPTPGNPLSI